MFSAIFEASIDKVGSFRDGFSCERFYVGSVFLKTKNVFGDMRIIQVFQIESVFFVLFIKCRNIEKKTVCIEFFQCQSDAFNFVFSHGSQSVSQNLVDFVCIIRNVKLDPIGSFRVITRDLHAFACLDSLIFCERNEFVIYDIMIGTGKCVAWLCECDNLFCCEASVRKARVEVKIEHIRKV